MKDFLFIDYSGRKLLIRASSLHQAKKELRLTIAAHNRDSIVNPKLVYNEFTLKT